MQKDNEAQPEHLWLYPVLTAVALAGGLALSMEMKNADREQSTTCADFNVQGQKIRACAKAESILNAAAASIDTGTAPQIPFYVSPAP